MPLSATVDLQKINGVPLGPTIPISQTTAVGSFLLPSGAAVGTLIPIITNNVSYSNLIVQMVFAGASGVGSGQLVVAVEGNCSNDGNAGMMILPTFFRLAGSNTNDAYVGYGAASSFTFNGNNILAFMTNCAGITNVRMRVVTNTLGAGNYLFTWTLNSFPFSPPVIQPYISATSGLADGQAVGAPNNVNASTSVLGVGTWLAPGAPSGAPWVAQRTPNFFKTASVTNFGNSAVWTPTSGKKFRLMRYQLELTENATLAVAAVLIVKFQDATTDFGFQHDIFVAAAAGAVSGEAWRSGWIDMGNGYLSALANNVLNLNISGAANLTAGNFRANVCGTEE